VPRVRVFSTQLTLSSVGMSIREMDIRMFLPPRPGFPPSTVIVTGVPDDAERSHVETLARKVLEARDLTPYMGRVGWAEVESAGLRYGIGGKGASQGAVAARTPRKAGKKAPARPAKSTRRTSSKKPGKGAKKKSPPKKGRIPGKKRTS
jgi:hypothetical protein